MSSEKLINAIGLLDDDLISDAEKRPEKNSYDVYIKYTAIAASLLLVILAAFLIKNSFGGNDSEPENTLLAEITDTQTQYTEAPITTAEPAPTDEIIHTQEPISNEIRTDEIIVNRGEQHSSAETHTPEPVITTEPKDPLQDITKEPEVIQATKEPIDIEKEDDSSTPEVTMEPVATEIPNSDTSWTDEFIVSNVEQSEGIDKMTAMNFVSQLYYSSFTSGADVFYENNGEWWYGVKNGEVLYTQAGVNIPENHVEIFMGESVLKGINRINYTSKETKAYMYKISGVAENAAIAVKIDEQEGYYLFVNTDYKATNVKEFIDVYNLSEYADLKTLAIYRDKKMDIFENKPLEIVWDILATAEGGSVDYKTLFFDYEVSATIEMNAEIYGCIDVPIALYDEGYVVMYLGNIHGAFYVGADKIALIKALAYSQ